MPYPRFLLPVLLFVIMLLGYWRLAGDNPALTNSVEVVRAAVSTFQPGSLATARSNPGGVSIEDSIAGYFQVPVEKVRARHAQGESYAAIFSDYARAQVPSAANSATGVNHAAIPRPVAAANATADPGDPTVPAATRKIAEPTVRPDEPSVASPGIEPVVLWSRPELSITLSAGNPHSEQLTLRALRPLTDVVLLSAGKAGDSLTVYPDQIRKLDAQEAITVTIKMDVTEERNSDENAMLIVKAADRPAGKPLLVRLHVESRSDGN